MFIFKIKKKDDPHSNFKCGELDRGYDQVYRYLGLHFNEFLDYKYTVTEIAKSTSQALSALHSKFISCGGITYSVFNKLFKSLVEPVMYYGAGIWGHTKWREIQIFKIKRADCSLEVHQTHLM